MYNPKSKVRFLLLSFIAAISFKVKTRENKKWSQKKTNEAKRLVKFDFFFKTAHF